MPALRPRAAGPVATVAAVLVLLAGCSSGADEPDSAGSSDTPERHPDQRADQRSRPSEPHRASPTEEPTERADRGARAGPPDLDGRPRPGRPDRRRPAARGGARADPRLHVVRRHLRVHDDGPGHRAAADQRRAQRADRARSLPRGGAGARLHRPGLLRPRPGHDARARVPRPARLRRAARRLPQPRRVDRRPARRAGGPARLRRRRGRRAPRAPDVRRRAGRPRPDRAVRPLDGRRRDDEGARRRARPLRRRAWAGRPSRASRRRTSPSSSAPTRPSPS